MRVEGRITTVDGTPVSGAVLEGRDATRATLCQTLSDIDGKYVVESEGIIAINCYPPKWGQIHEFTHMPAVRRITGVPRPKETVVDIVLQPAISVPIVAYTPEGELLGGPTKEGQALLNTKVFDFLNLNDIPATGAICWSNGAERPCLLMPPDQPRKLRLLWTAAPYGRVVCVADNQGRGFIPSKSGIFLNLELAKTAWNRLTTEVQKCSDGGYKLSSSFVGVHKQASRAFRDLNEASSQRTQAKCADRLLALSLEAGEILVTERAGQRIERLRRRPHCLQVQDSAGKPVHGKLTLKQKEHEFRFGIFMTPEDHPIQRIPLDSAPVWKRLKDIGFNQMSVILIWSRLEKERGVRTQQQEYAIWPAEDIRKAGFKLKDHISVWFWHGQYPEYWGVITPDWTYDLSFAELKEEIYKHKCAISQTYHQHLDEWQAINEPMLAHTNCLNLNLEQTVEVVKEAVRAIRKYSPDQPIEVNSCQVFGENIQADVWEQGYERSPDAFYKSLLENGVDFDTVGMQMYYGGYIGLPPFEGGFPIRHPWDLEQIIERYSRLGKPIRITEVSIPSSFPSEDSGIDFGFWHKPWDEEMQARWVELFYTLCYSIPEVQEVTWWNATDEGAFISDGGLLHADYSPKPAADTLGSLISEWKIEGQFVIDDGRVDVHCAAGEYEITVDTGAAQQTFSLLLDPNKQKVSLIKMGS